MIFDTIENYKYYAKNAVLEQIFLNIMAMKDFSDHTEFLDGIKYMIQTYTTKDLCMDRDYECHQKYVDIQFIKYGTEKIGYAKNGVLSIAYDENKDISFYHQCEQEFLDMKENDFVVLFPGELHLGAIGMGNEVTKIVVKCPLAIFLSE